MSKHIKLKKGFNIKLEGKAEEILNENIFPSTYVFKPTDFVGVQRPKVLVDEGDVVKAGAPIFFDKKNPQVMFTAPVSGEIIEVKRGVKRFPLEIKILADQEILFEVFPKYGMSEIASLSLDEAKEQMLKSGVWANLIERPFGFTASADLLPRDIFISTFDTAPLAPDISFLLKGEEKYFQAGINILKKFTSGDIYLNIDAKAEVNPMFKNAEKVIINSFSGKHPTGNVGVQIHHIKPINKGDIVWTIHPYGVAQIGKLFLEGRYDASKLVALVGPEVDKPQYFKVYNGACIDKIIEGHLKDRTQEKKEAEEEAVFQNKILKAFYEKNEGKYSEVSPKPIRRYISGNVLTGKKIDENGYIGFYDHQITVIREGDRSDFLGWILPTSKTSRSLSFQKALGTFSFLLPGKKYHLDTNTNGEERPFVQTGVYEKVLPMNIYIVYLLKAIMAEDYEAMEALGIYEVLEEDIALCEFVDVSKIDMQEILREGIEWMQKN